MLSYFSVFFSNLFIKCNDGIAFLIGVVYFIRSDCDWSQLKQPPRVWITGIAGLFGYHALYFAAMRSAPAIEVD